MRHHFPNHFSWWLPLAALPLAALPVMAAPTPPTPPTAPLTAASATPPAPTAAPGPAVTLRYKFTPGQVLRYRMTTDTDGTIQMGTGGMSIPLKDHMVIVMRQTVKSVRATDGAATLESGIDSVTGTANGQPLPPAATAQLEKRTTTLVLSPIGKVLSMQMPAGTPMAGMGNITQSGTESALPAGPVHVGDTWSGDAALSSIGNVAMTSTLTGLDTGGTIAAIAQTTHAHVHMTPPGLPVSLTAQGTITGTGQMHFDTVAGAVQDQTSAMTMDMTMAAHSPAAGTTAPALPPQLAHMTMHMHTTMHMTRLPDTPIAPAPPPAPAAPAPANPAL